LTNSGVVVLKMVTY